MPKRIAKAESTESAWRVVWMHDPFMLNRLELVVAHGRDWFPGSSNSAILEAQIAALVEGVPLRVAKQAGELNPNAQEALDQLFRMRDAGQIGGAKAHVGSHPAHRGEHHPGGAGPRHRVQPGGA